MGWLKIINNWIRLPKCSICKNYISDNEERLKIGMMFPEPIHKSCFKDKTGITQIERDIKEIRRRI